MPMLPNIDEIDFLIRRRFPFYQLHKGQLASLSLGSRGPTGIDRAELDRRTAEIEAYQTALRQMPSDERTALYREEYEKYQKEQLALAEAKEKALFFNQPSAAADVDYWSKTAHWSLDEAIALSFGKEPEIVNWQTVGSYVHISAFAKAYAKRRDLAQRAIVWKQLFDPVLPSIFLGWAKRNEIAYPKQLEELLVARGNHIVDWKAEYDKLRAEATKLLQEKAEAIAEIQAELEGVKGGHALALALAQSPIKKRKSELSTRETQTAMKLIVGMACGYYGYDPNLPRNTAVAQIADDLLKFDLQLDEDTIRKWIQRAVGEYRELANSLSTRKKKAE